MEEGDAPVVLFQQDFTRPRLDMSPTLQDTCSSERFCGLLTQSIQALFRYYLIFYGVGVREGDISLGPVLWNQKAPMASPCVQAL